ncbi:MAG TPA: 2OG-Fe dioxygenase family protein, partial [Vicinamibacterales bacterium]|nr:2OG-Fe dioxygenase family protein [Vicinamibacterales bacterium]
MSFTAILPDRSLQESLSHDGFVFVQAAAMRRAFEAFGSLADWPMFADSWNALDLDEHMADGGRYRRRRHAVFAAGREGAIERQPHQPHYQTVDYNPLNGGVARWFAPVTPDVGGGQSLTTILGFCRALFDRLA